MHPENYCDAKFSCARGDGIDDDWWQEEEEDDDDDEDEEINDEHDGQNSSDNDDSDGDASRTCQKRDFQQQIWRIMSKKLHQRRSDAETEFFWLSEPLRNLQLVIELALQERSSDLDRERLWLLVPETKKVWALCVPACVNRKIRTQALQKNLQ